MRLSKSNFLSSRQYQKKLWLELNKKEQIRSQLLKYCELDTFAMIEILNFFMSGEKQV